MKEETLRKLREELNQLNEEKYDTRRDRTWGDSVSSSIYYNDNDKDNEKERNEEIEEIQERISALENDSCLPNKIDLIKRALYLSLYAWQELNLNQLKRGLKIKQEIILDKIIKEEIRDQKLTDSQGIIRIKNINSFSMNKLDKFRHFPDKGYKVMKERAKKIQQNGIYYS